MLVIHRGTRARGPARRRAGVATFPDPDDRRPMAPDCRRCADLAAARERISWGVGSLEATLVVVGEAPGAGDPGADRWRGGNHTGMAFTASHSGRRVRNLFEGLGYEPGELYFTNAVKCFPAGEEGSNREPTPAERANCRPYLLAELETVAPDCVVPTGRHATESLLSAVDRRLDGFLETVLDPVEADGLPPVLPVLHPSYQDVWISRLGFADGAAYRDAVGDALADLGVGPG